ncbi:NUDIX hydrolase [Nocardioides marmorisolisilvae]|uniref:NUDIX domain-containing protein n=1 Tax=Nocardioides marmorisolisilvae TaxID=1542737 RepID=A0A3N0DRJ1_9ACTN|nr:NUDIX domain-containing protein [Nocardioides marmorisolisilvae]RNL78248.1 NUDIX domain-containing protein [Nocardioides marmorisolisilvae]
MNDLHADALRVLSGWTAPSAEQDAWRSEYVAHLESQPDGLKKACFPDHLTAGALVLNADGSQVLLNLHGKAQRWFAFGGHLEPEDTTLAGAALREATEESGLADLVIDPEPVHLSLHTVDFCNPRGPVRHLDVRFLARLGGDSQPVVSDESLDVRWFSSDDLPTDEPDMVDLIRLARERQRA